MFSQGSMQSRVPVSGVQPLHVTILCRYHRMLGLSMVTSMPGVYPEVG
jgi:hypothetical protein